MTIQWSTALRNARLDAIETAIGVSAQLRLYTGSPPANCGTGATGTLVIQYTLVADWSANASGGTKSLSNLPLSGPVTGAGSNTIGYYRFYDSAGSVCHEQGTVTVTGGGGDMTVDNPAVTNGQTVQVTGFTKTEAGA